MTDSGNLWENHDGDEPPSNGVQAFQDPGNAHAIVLTDANDLDGAQATGRWLASPTPTRIKR